MYEIHSRHDRTMFLDKITRTYWLCHSCQFSLLSGWEKRTGQTLHVHELIE